MKGRRYKVYAADTGISYQYYFAWRRRVTRPEDLGAGSDFIFVISSGPRLPFLARVFVSDRAMQAWRQLHGRELDASELYAVAKMRLFRAFDELDQPGDEWSNLIVNESNIVGLLQPLGLTED